MYVHLLYVFEHNAVHCHRTSYLIIIIIIIEGQVDCSHTILISSPPRRARIAGIESESRESGVARSGTLTLTLLLLARSLAPTTRRPLALVLVHRLAVPSTVSTTSLTPSPSDAPRGIGCSKLVGCCILQERFTVSPSCYLLVHSRHGFDLELEHQLACSRHLSCSTTWLPSAARRRGSHLVPREREGGLLQPRHGHQP